MSDPVTIQIVRCSGCEDIPLPAYETELAAGMDLRAAVTEPVTLPAGAHTMLPTGIRLALPTGVEAQVRPRSGLAARHGISMLNTPGTIDADYRGEIKIILVNHGSEPFTIQRGDRIAQLVIAPVLRAHWQCVAELEETDRSDGGFGHTGV